MTHMMLNRSALRCSCGAQFYEDDRGRIYCEVGGRVAQYPEHLRHSAMCHRDDEGIWKCATRCAVYQAQTELAL